MTTKLDPRDRALLLGLRSHLFAAALVPLTASTGCWGKNCDPDINESTWTLEELAASYGTPGDTGASSDTGFTAGTTTEPLTECPPGNELTGSYSYFGSTTATGPMYAIVPCDTQGSPRLVSSTDEDCTYRYECWYCCGYGRPLLDTEGNPIKPDVSDDDAWKGTPVPDLAGLTPEEREQAGAHWLENARAEHSSVAGFHRFALDLLAHGAPPELVLQAQKAASQEVGHAMDCFALASAYLGRPVGPAPIPLKEAPIAADLAQLAAWTARDGVVGETVAALLAARCLGMTTDPAVRAVLERIVREETEHAELALATVRWAMEVGGAPVVHAVREVIASAHFADVDEPMPGDALLAHGLPDPQAQVALTRACIAELLVPLVEELVPRAA